MNVGTKAVWASFLQEQQGSKMEEVQANEQVADKATHETKLSYLWNTLDLLDLNLISCIFLKEKVHKFRGKMNKFRGKICLRENTLRGNLLVR